MFVDAGYLFAQGSVALSGSKKARIDLVLDAPAVVAELRALIAVRSSTCSLLRIYWYDGAIGGVRLTADQTALANLADVKVRLGFINSFGQQKGVDSLIVTDLIELARQKAICDAVLLSGDEDVRVGVQIAQNYGVRIHLLGIHPSRGSQSPQLLLEADTTQEWDQVEIRRFLSERTHSPAPPVNFSSTEEAESDEDQLVAVARRFSDELHQSELESLSTYWKGARGLPPEFDKRLLPAARDALGRNLERDEMRSIRRHVQSRVVERITAG